MNIYFYALFSKDYAFILESVEQLEQSLIQHYLLSLMKNIVNWFFRADYIIPKEQHKNY